ncbi:hypothetical protein EAF00_003069 [Botryotinia globosa]|nr:hypothetical protein EAF00_003069 [Botryotinia globosa]
MEEVEVPLTPTDPSTPAAATAVIPVVGAPPKTETEEFGYADEASYTLMQKGLFLAVILGCVASYMRMNKRSKKFESILSIYSDLFPIRFLSLNVPKNRAPIVCTNEFLDHTGLLEYFGFPSHPVFAALINSLEPWSQCLEGQLYTPSLDYHRFLTSTLCQSSRLTTLSKVGSDGVVQPALYQAREQTGLTKGHMMEQQCDRLSPLFSFSSDSAAALNDVAFQPQLPLRHDTRERKDSDGGTRIKPDKLDMSATGLIDSQSSAKKKLNSRVLYCDILGPDGTLWLPKSGRKRRQMKNRRYREAVQAKEAKNARGCRDRRKFGNERYAVISNPIQEQVISCSAANESSAE